PARYTEAKLIKELEELGIGRPSTYASIIDTIVTRRYVEMVDRTFKPTESGILTNSQLVAYFDSIINVEYTAQMEEVLDDIADGEDDYVHALTSFEERFEPLLENAYENMEQVQPEKTGEKCPECGSDLVIRKGKYGDFVACSSYPKCKYIKKEPKEVDYTGETCPKCGSPMVYKMGRYGRFQACSSYPECKYIKKEKKVKQEPVETGEVCPNCGSPIVIKKGRWGEFKACSSYPKCKTIIKEKKS
ncbi:MAG: topoisomerase DNA-binding C4 zinc finger domain-containing protein, partial [Erysipelotrichaceae bacterium]|nr:topoisomerase DNA-binding C4 zinc finger domain-containing protein [Erysipelotrichaceae bacterium]